MEFDKIMIPIGGQGVCESTIKVACTIARKSVTIIYVVYVIKLERSLSLDAEVESEIRKAEEVLGQAREMAAKADCDVETGIIQAREAGPAIVDEATDREVDLILMGMDYERPFGIFSLGDVVPYILRKAPCPVLIVREAPPQDNSQQ